MLRVLMTGVDHNMPTVHDPDSLMYIREWSGGILAGFAPLNARSCYQDGIPASSEFQLLPEDWDHIRKLNIVMVSAQSTNQCTQELEKVTSVYEN